MSDPIVVSADGPTPGQMIREAREAQGLHVAALAAALKVPVRKLDALENNRWDELTDATFTRAFASTVARHLKIDTGPLLERLPASRPASLSSPVGLGRMQDGASSVAVVFTPAAALFSGSRIWVVLLLLAAATLYFYPGVWVLWGKSDASSVAPTAVAESGVLQPILSAAGGADSNVSHAVESASLDASVRQHVVEAPTTEANLLALTATVDSWVEVIDSLKRVRFQRVLKQGEEIVFTEGAPFAVVVGNASGAKVMVRGASFDLASVAKNNVARFEVK